MMVKATVFVYGAVLGLAALTLLPRRGKQDRSAETDLFAADRLPWGYAVALTFAFVFALQLVFRTGIVHLQGGDEYCRAYFAFDWARHPFFAPADHVWLAGQFYALGAAYHFLGSLPLAVAVTSLSGVWATVFFAMLLARRIWGSPTAAMFAGLLVGSEWFLLWTTVNPYAEAFFFPAFLAGFWAWLAAWQHLQDGGGEGNWPGEFLFLLTAACIGFGTMFRYEMWYAGILLGIFLGCRMVWLLIRPGRRRMAWIPLVGCLLLSGYPVAWMVSNWMGLGSPFAFLETTSRLNRETNLFYDFSSGWGVFLAYPRILIADHWPRLALCGLGFLLAWVGARRPAWAALAPVPILLALAMILTARSGIGSNNRARYSEFLVLPLLCFGSGALGYLWIAGSGWSRVIGRGIVVGFMAIAMGHGLKTARDTYPSGWGISPEFLQIAARLEREHDSGRPVDGVVRLQPHDTLLGVCHNRNWLDYWIIIYHSTWPENVRELDSLEIASQFLKSSPPGTRALIRGTVPDPAFPPNARRLDRMGDYEMWVIEMEQPGQPSQQGQTGQ